MNDVSGKNLNWFFNNWFFTNYYIDLSLQKISKAADGYLAQIKNVCGFAIPFDVKITYTDGTTETKHQSPAIWERDQKQVSLNIKTAKTIKTVTLDGGIFMDATEKDNTLDVK
jgi:hypothetical protein